MSRALVASFLALTLVPALLAQHRGSGGTKPAARGTQSGTRDQIQSRDRLNDRTRDQDRLRDRDLQRDRQSLHTRTTDAQRQQYSEAKTSATQVRDTAREMRQSAKGGTFSGATAREQHLRLQQQVRSMQQQQTRLMQSMSGDQSSAVRARAEEMSRIQERMNTRLQSMQNELQQPNPNPRRVAEEARLMENDTKRWQEQHRNIASTLGLQD